MTTKDSDLVLFTGASKGLGLAIFDSLVLKGFSCAKAGRNEERTYSLGVSPAMEILADVKTIIHFAYDYSGDTYQRSNEINVLGSRQLLDLAEKSLIRHIIMVSTDSAQENAKSVYGRTKYEIENLFRTSTKASIIRIGLIGGVNPMGPFGRIVSIARRFRLAIIPIPDRPNFTYVKFEDLVKVFERLIESGPCGGPFSASRDGALMNLQSALSKELAGGYFLVKIPSVLLYWVLKMKESIFVSSGIRSDSIKSLDTPAPKAKVESIWNVLRLQ